MDRMEEEDAFIMYASMRITETWYWKSNGGTDGNGSIEKRGHQQSILVAFTSNELGNGFWKNMGWTFRKDMNYYEFDLNPENVTVFNT